MHIKSDTGKHLVISFCIVVGVFCSGSALSICIENFTVPLLLIANILLLSYKIITNHYKIKVSFSKETKYLYVFVGFILLSLIVNFSFTGLSAWLRLLLTLSLVGMIVSELSADLLIKYYVNIMRIIALISLIGYFLFVVIGIPTNFIPIVQKITDSSVKYHSLGIYNIWITEFTRNCGPFWEPSIFAAFLSIALIFVVFFDDRSKKLKDILLLSICIITTQSTGGYILLFLILMMSLWKNKNNILLAVISILMCLVIVVAWGPISLYLLNLNYNIFSKIVYFESMGTSMTRYYSVLINLKIWWENNILCGVGLSDVDTLYIFYRDVIAPVALAPAQTSTTTLMIAALGVGGFYYFYIWLKAISIQKMSLVSKLIFIIIITYILNQTPHCYFFLTYYLLFTLLKSGSIKKCKQTSKTSNVLCQTIQQSS